MRVTREPDGTVRVELTRRNLEVLLAKLDMPASARTIGKERVWIKSVEDDEHYADRPPGPMLVGDAIV